MARRVKKRLQLCIAATTVLTIIAAASFGFIPAFTEFVSYGGATKSVFDVIYDVFYDTILPLNGLLICLFVWWHWRYSSLEQELAEAIQIVEYIFGEVCARVDHHVHSGDLIRRVR